MNKFAKYVPEEDKKKQREHIGAMGLDEARLGAIGSRVEEVTLLNHTVSEEYFYEDGLTFYDIPEAFTHEIVPTMYDNEFTLLIDGVNYPCYIGMDENGNPHLATENMRDFIGGGGAPPANNFYAGLEYRDGDWHNGMEIVVFEGSLVSHNTKSIVLKTTMTVFDILPASNLPEGTMVNLSLPSVGDNLSYWTKAMKKRDDYIGTKVSLFSTLGSSLVANVYQTETDEGVNISFVKDKTYIEIIDMLFDNEGNYVSKRESVPMLQGETMTCALVQSSDAQKYKSVFCVCPYNGQGYTKEEAEAAALFMIGNDGSIYMKSSTEGSNKRFKITVNDSGTISAVEA